LKFRKLLITFVLITSLSLILVSQIEATPNDDFPVGLLLDYTYTNAETNCEFHFDIYGWVPSPYNSSEFVLEIYNSVTGDCLNCWDINRIFIPSWAIYDPSVGSSWMRPLFTNTSDWYIGKDLKTSPVTMFYTQTEIHVENITRIMLPFGSLQCWWVKATQNFTDYTQESDFYFDVEWGICLRYYRSGPGYPTLEELYSTNIEFSNITIQDTQPTTTTTIATQNTTETTPQANTTITPLTNITSPWIMTPEVYTIVLGSGVAVVIVMVFVTIQYRKVVK